MKKRIFNSNKGYTLIELLAVIIVMVVVGVIVTGILSSSLRGGSKSNVLGNVIQNGNNAITQISKMLTFARNFNGVSTDNITYTTNCIQTIPPSPSPSPTPVAYKSIKITSFDGGVTVFSCNGPSDNPANTIASNGASLIDTSTILTVPSSCYFTCIQDNFGQIPTIKINFTLSQITSNNLVEKTATVPFETSVTMRNIGF